MDQSQWLVVAIRPIAAGGDSQKSAKSSRLRQAKNDPQLPFAEGSYQLVVIQSVLLIASVQRSSTSQKTTRDFKVTVCR